MASAHPDAGPVLVTGATGYLAGWVVVELLRRGRAVRGTVRDADRAEPVRRALLDDAGGVGTLELVSADLLADAGWDEALDGVDAVIHTASPMPFDAEVDLIRSATEGTRRVLGAAAAAGVRRVVLTSSGVTAHPDDPDDVATEEHWAEPSGDPLQAYPDSKIHAERLAWQLAEELGLRLTVVLPSFMQGPPVRGPVRTGTIDAVRRLLDGAMPALPRLGWNVVDVRDEAVLHVLALEHEDAVGQRYHGSGTFLWYRDVARILRDGIPDAARAVPTRQLPDVLVRLMARRNRQLAMIVGELGITRRVDHTKATTQLGWQPRDVETTILDTARALVADGAGR